MNKLKEKYQSKSPSDPDFFMFFILQRSSFKIPMLKFCGSSKRCGNVMSVVFIIYNQRY